MHQIVARSDASMSKLIFLVYKLKNFSLQIEKGDWKPEREKFPQVKGGQMWWNVISDGEDCKSFCVCRHTGLYKSTG